MSWTDTIVVTIIIIGGIFLLYPALKEPIDLVLHWLGKGFVGLKNMISGASEETYDNVITYG